MADIDRCLREFTGYSVKRALNAIQADVNATLRPFGLRMVTFSLLSVIAANTGLRQSQLADALAIERPNIVQLLDELERAGLITRTRATDDRRAYALHLTEPGAKVHAAATAAVREHDARMTVGLSNAQRGIVVAALQLIERNGAKEKTDDAVAVPAP
ncbi:MAG: MarR family transcriptional regulator [Rhodobacter sp.]|nr:MarR family transcriptional regulator [Rhodobacter sp.]